MNGPLLGNMGGGGSGLGQIGDAQAMAAAKNVSLMLIKKVIKAKTGAKVLETANSRLDAKYNGVMPCEDCNVRDNGFCARRSLWPLHGIGLSTH